MAFYVNRKEVEKMIYNSNEELNRILAQNGIENIEISNSLSNVGTIASSATVTASVNKIDTMINSLGAIDTYKETVRRTLGDESLSDSEICSPDFIEKLPSKIIHTFCKDLVKIVLEEYEKVLNHECSWQGTTINNYDPFHLITILLQTGALKPEDLDRSPDFLKRKEEDYKLAEYEDKEESNIVHSIRVNGKEYNLTNPIFYDMDAKKDYYYKMFCLGDWNASEHEEVEVKE